MRDEMAPAIAALENKLAEQNRAVLETKRSINLLLKVSGQPLRYPEHEEISSGAMRPDQFYGKGLIASAAEYLAARKQACQPEEILRALESGGFDFSLMKWAEDDRLRSFSISLSKNSSEGGKFHKLKNGSFGLRGWYDEDFLKKASADAAEKTASKKKKAAKKGAPKPSAKNGNARAEEAKQPELLKPKSSAKPKDRLAADQTAQKEAAS